MYLKAPRFGKDRSRTSQHLESLWYPLPAVRMTKAPRHHQGQPLGTDPCTTVNGPTDSLWRDTLLSLAIGVRASVLPGNNMSYSPSKALPILRSGRGTEGEEGRVGQEEESEWEQGQLCKMEKILYFKNSKKKWPGHSAAHNHFRIHGILCSLVLSSLKTLAHLPALENGCLQILQPDTDSF